MVLQLAAAWVRVTEPRELKAFLASLLECSTSCSRHGARRWNRLLDHAEMRVSMKQHRRWCANHIGTVPYTLSRSRRLKHGVHAGSPPRVQATRSDGLPPGNGVQESEGSDLTAPVTSSTLHMRQSGRPESPDAVAAAQIPSQQLSSDKRLHPDETTAMKLLPTSEIVVPRPMRLSTQSTASSEIGGTSEVTQTESWSEPWETNGSVHKRNHGPADIATPLSARTTQDLDTYADTQHKPHTSRTAHVSRSVAMHAHPSTVANGATGQPSANAASTNGSEGLSIRVPYAPVSGIQGGMVVESACETVPSTARTKEGPITIVEHGRRKHSGTAGPSQPSSAFNSRPPSARRGELSFMPVPSLNGGSVRGLQVDATNHEGKLDISIHSQGRTPDYTPGVSPPQEPAQWSGPLIETSRTRGSLQGSLQGSRRTSHDSIQVTSIDGRHSPFHHSITASTGAYSPPASVATHHFADQDFLPQQYPTGALTSILSQPGSLDGGPSNESGGLMQPLEPDLMLVKSMALQAKAVTSPPKPASRSGRRRRKAPSTAPASTEFVGADAIGENSGSMPQTQVEDGAEKVTGRPAVDKHEGTRSLVDQGPAAANHSQGHALPPGLATSSTATVSGTVVTLGDPSLHLKTLSTAQALVQSGVSSSWLSSQQPVADGRPNGDASFPPRPPRPLPNPVGVGLRPQDLQQAHRFPRGPPGQLLVDQRDFESEANIATQTVRAAARSVRKGVPQPLLASPSQTRVTVFPPSPQSPSPAALPGCVDVDQHSVASTSAAASTPLSVPQWHRALSPLPRTETASTALSGRASTARSNRGRGSSGVHVDDDVMPDQASVANSMAPSERTGISTVDSAWRLGPPKATSNTITHVSPLQNRLHPQSGSRSERSPSRRKPRTGRVLSAKASRPAPQQLQDTSLTLTASSQDSAGMLETLTTPSVVRHSSRSPIRGRPAARAQPNWGQNSSRPSTSVMSRRQAAVMAEALDGLQGTATVPRRGAVWLSGQSDLTTDNCQHAPSLSLDERIRSISLCSPQSDSTASPWYRPTPSSGPGFVWDAAPTDGRAIGLGSNGSGGGASMSRDKPSTLKHAPGSTADRKQRDELDRVRSVLGRQDIAGSTRPVVALSSSFKLTDRDVQRTPVQLVTHDLSASTGLLPLHGTMGSPKPATSTAASRRALATGTVRKVSCNSPSPAVGWSADLPHGSFPATGRSRRSEQEIMWGRADSVTAGTTTGTVNEREA